MAKKPKIGINHHSGLVEYDDGNTVIEFVREDIEQICRVLLSDVSLNVDLNGMRLKQSKWKWWYGIEKIKLQYKYPIDSPVVKIGIKEADLLYKFFLDNWASIASYKDVE